MITSGFELDDDLISDPRAINTFNTDKCKVLHLGKNNEKHEYVLNGKPIGVVNSERDLGVTIDRTLKFSEHCNIVANSANSVLGMIKRTITCRSKNIIARLYKALVRPKLEYCAQASRCLETILKEGYRQTRESASKGNKADCRLKK